MGFRSLRDRLIPYVAVISVTVLVTVLGSIDLIAFQNVELRRFHAVEDEDSYSELIDGHPTFCVAHGARSGLIQEIGQVDANSK